MKYIGDCISMQLFKKYFLSDLNKSHFCASATELTLNFSAPVA